MAQKARPTRTTNRLHFDDLDPRRFEDLGVGLVYRLRRWLAINHYGRSGTDEGIDIHAVEDLENGARRRWFIQCKRYQKLAKAELRAIVDSALERAETPPEVLLVIAGCAVSKTSHDDFQKYATTKGIGIPLIWDASVLEAKLYAEYHDLLFAYFGVSVTGERRDRIASLRRNIRLKQQLRRDLLAETIDPAEVARHPSHKFDCQNLVIRSIDDRFYPDHDPTVPGISSWFKVEPWDFYHNGLEVVMGIREAMFDQEGRWSLLGEWRPASNAYAYHNVFVIGRIPFDSIVDYDLLGDWYYNCPHLYCDFKYEGMPYEEIVYSLVPSSDDPTIKYPARLENADRLSLD